MKNFSAIRISSRDVLFENDHYLFLNKMKGWLVHGSVDEKRPNVLGSLRAFMRLRDGQGSNVTMHHRLDLHTSGVLLFAKSRDADAALARVFKEREIRKQYLGICSAVPQPASGTLEHFLKKRKIEGREKMDSVRSGGKKALTHYQVLESNPPLALVRFDLVTGRRHQIRVQSAVEGFPILGDAHYGNAPSKEGHWLHASILSFHDPISASPITVCAPTPGPFLEAFAKTTKSQAPAPSLVLFHKPYGVLSQFTSLTPEELTLADFGLPSHVYPVGRLDKDSEGLLLLTSSGHLHHRLAHPDHKKEKVYWVQVEGVPSESSLRAMRGGLNIRDYRTGPCSAKVIASPNVPARRPPIRVRKSVPTSWLAIGLREGKNRQIRKMTAAIGHPTLRLIRISIGNYRLGSLKVGEYQRLATPTEDLSGKLS